jgi:GNAT superfamily N-acetyltransferase
VFGYQSLDAELQALADRYGPPNGRTLIATLEGRVVAGGAWRRSGDAVCELKRVYVTDAARGHGLGRKLCEALMASARAEGFTRMQLDTGDRMTEALALYDRLGFQSIAPYNTYPARLLEHMVFLECAL